MNRGFAIALSAAVLIFVLLSVPSTRAQNPAAPAQQRTAEQAFKNVQLLKGASEDQFLTAMQFIGSSLGVECEYCHVQGAYEKDDKKPKQTARQMIEMQMAINKGHFKDRTEVTCYTCHHGSHDPSAVPAIADEEPKRPAARPAEAAAQTPPSGEQILAKYLQAAGGADALAKITSRTGKGTIGVGSEQFPVEIFAKAPNKRISFVHTPGGDAITAYDGRTGWLGSPGGRPPRGMRPSETESVSFDSIINLPAEVQKMFTQTRVRPADKIDGHEAVLVIGINEGKPPVRLFFDKDSGLLLRTIRYTETPLGRNPVQIDYTDYRSADGVKVPFQWTIARPLGRFTIQLSEVKQNVAVDDAKFAMPAPPAAPPATK